MLAGLKGKAESVEEAESPMVTMTIPNVTPDMASKMEQVAKEKGVEYSIQGNTVVVKGRRIDVTMFRTKMGIAQTNIPMDPIEEAKDKHCSDKCCGSEVTAEDCTCPPTCKHCNCNAVKESNITEMMTLKCKDCGDMLGEPTTDCPHDSQDPSGDNWIMVDVDNDGDMDIAFANEEIEEVDEAAESIAKLKAMAGVGSKFRSNHGIHEGEEGYQITPRSIVARELRKLQDIEKGS